MLCLYSNGDPFCLFYDDLQNNPAWSRTDLVSEGAFSNSLPRRIQSVLPLLNYAHFNFTGLLLTFQFALLLCFAYISASSKGFKQLPKEL